MLKHWRYIFCYVESIYDVTESQIISLLTLDNNKKYYVSYYYIIIIFGPRYIGPKYFKKKKMYQEFLGGIIGENTFINHCCGLDNVYHVLS